ncbi:helix-turn-helix domain-containing protein, partial [Clostridium perfringens]
LNRIRLEKAKERLLTTDDAISDISESVGYSDQSYFTKVFKKMTGVSPSRYRRQHAAEMRKL